MGLAEHCEFGAGADTMVRDIIVINMSNSEVQDELMKKVMIQEKTVEYTIPLEQTKKRQDYPGIRCIWQLVQRR